MKLVFEKSRPGRRTHMLAKCDVDEYKLEDKYARKSKLNLPEMVEGDISRHYTEIVDNTHGVNNGFYPLGSCTMKYNPKINDEIAAMPGFKDIHPLQPQHTVQGCLQVIDLAREYFCEITGMDNMSFQPAAGAQGEFAGILLIKAYHEDRKDNKRTKIMIPDSAHGTNPSTAAMAGYDVVSVPSRDDGSVDLDKLKELIGEDTAGLMLTNPSTIGMFEKEVVEITKTIHDVGGLVYYDGANLNPIMGVVRPGDMGFDVIHLNLHKTFSTPHGGGGPGSGPVGCKKILEKYLPTPWIEKEGQYKLTYDHDLSIGSMKSFYGNFLVYIKALAYAMTLGGDRMAITAKNATLNANYMMYKLKDIYPMAFPGPCMHEFVMSIDKLKKEKGVTALDISKALLDYGIHPPTMYFPLIVPEALMIEPTETESRETLDQAIGVFREIYKTAMENPEELKKAPQTTIVGRLDEVTAARNPILRYEFK